MSEEFMRKETCTERHDGLDGRLENIEDGVERIEKKLDKNGNGILWKVLGIMLTFAVGIIVIVTAIVYNG